MWRILALCSLWACSATPDAFELTYGREFAGDSSIESWPMLNEDSDYVGIGFTWNLKPREVVIAPTPRATAVEDLGFAIQEAQEIQRQVQKEEIDSIGGALRTFTAMDIASRIMLVLFGGWLLWIYREPIKRMFPGGGKP